MSSEWLQVSSRKMHTICREHHIGQDNLLNSLPQLVFWLWAVLQNIADGLLFLGRVVISTDLPGSSGKTELCVNDGQGVNISQMTG